MSNGGRLQRVSERTYRMRLRATSRRFAARAPQLSMLARLRRFARDAQRPRAC